MGLLDVLLRKVIQVAGSALPERKFWNFASGATAVDNPITGATDITINGNGPSVAIAALAIDWSKGNVFSKTLSAGANVFTFANAVDGQTIIVTLVGVATATVTFPTVDWGSAGAPVQRTAGTDVYTLVKVGATIYGAVRQ